MDFLQGETGNSVTRQSQVPFMDCILFQIGQLERINLRGGWPKIQVDRSSGLGQVTITKDTVRFLHVVFYTLPSYLF